MTMSALVCCRIQGHSTSATPPLLGRDIGMQIKMYLKWATEGSQLSLVYAWILFDFQFLVYFS